MTRRKIPWDTWGPKRFPSAQCRAFLECENIPGPSGYCVVHPRRRKQVRMMPAELSEHGVDVTISHGGAVVRQRDFEDANEAFSDTLPGRDD